VVGANSSEDFLVSLYVPVTQKCSTQIQRTTIQQLTRTYISGTDTYPHISILRPHSARFHERRISSMTFTSAHLYGNVYMRVGVARALADLSNFGHPKEQSSQKC